MRQLKMVHTPISLVYKKGLNREKHPLLLTGYGAYGISYDTFFSADRLSLLDRDIIYAVAHVRGGGELGRPWYFAGKGLNKNNTFSDFITCAEHLINQNYTSREQLVIEEQRGRLAHRCCP